jgi:hypothetical protein
MANGTAASVRVDVGKCMRKRAFFSHPGSQYTAFLFEPLGDDRNGVPLALASILGRMSLDPWSEAASLAAMPPEVAAQKLASLIEAMPNHALPRLESNTLAERLIRLLPKRSNPTDPATEPLADAHATKRGPLVTYLVWIVLFCLLLVAATIG